MAKLASKKSEQSIKVSFLEFQTIKSLPKFNSQSDSLGDKHGRSKNLSKETHMRIELKASQAFEKTIITRPHAHISKNSL
jgi:hypothetical protein